MKFKAINPDTGRVMPLVLFAVLALGLLAGSLAAQETLPTHEYRAEGETTIETINGMRVITLRDNVYVRQNAIELTGDLAVLEYNLDRVLQRVSLTGSPATFRQQPEADDLPITGSSETINYYAGAETVVEFVGSATFNQPGTTLVCEQIRHVIETGATSGQPCSGSVSPQTN